MLSLRALRVAAFASLVITSVFWVWVVAGLLAVHWPNNGQQLAAGPVLLAAVGIVGYGLMSTILALLGRSAQSMASVILEGVSIASLLVILGGVAYFSVRVVGLLPLPLPDIMFPLIGLAGSFAAALSYGRVRSRDRDAGGRSPPARPEPSGNSA